MRYRLSYLLFADVKGYSELSDAQLGVFCSSVLSAADRIIREREPFYVNSWGDAFVAAFDDPVRAADCALALRDYFRNTVWVDAGLPESLSLRISLHAGRVITFEDPLTGGTNVYGREVSRAARIEPIVTPNEVFTTDLVIRTLERLESASRFQWDPLGRHPLAKAWGAEELFRLRRSHERAAISGLAFPEIINVFRIPEENDKRDLRMKEVFGEKYDTLSLLALSGFHYVHSQGKNWLLGINRHLDEGRPMRLLLAHPEGDEARVRERAEGRRSADAFLKVPLSRLDELQHRYAGLEIKLTTLPLYCSLFFTGQSVFYDPYHLGYLPGSDSGQNRMLVVEMRTGQRYDILMSHFEFLWNDLAAMRVSDVISRYRREIDGGAGSA